MYRCKELTLSNLTKSAVSNKDRPEIVSTSVTILEEGCRSSTLFMNEDILASVRIPYGDIAEHTTLFLNADDKIY